MVESKTWIDFENPKEGGSNEVNRKAFEWNIKGGSQMLTKHPLTLGVHQHGNILIQNLL
jgi:hypothetical protein